MRSLIQAVTAALLLLAGASAAAQTYPTKPVKVIVPYAAGGNMEHWRPTLSKVGQLLGQNFFVDYRPGAGGNIGSRCGFR